MYKRQILNAEQVTFELDFNDQAQIAEFAAMQTYADGTTLADHISPELYQVVVETAAQMGMDEQTIAQYKACLLYTSMPLCPWWRVAWESAFCRSLF